MLLFYLVTYFPLSKVGESMNNAELILEIQKQYDARTREEVLANLNISVALGKSKGLEVDRYRALPKVTNCSKHTVMSWFNRPDKRIPLIDLCMIASYLHYNIFSFFTIKKNCEVSTADFLIANDYYNTNYPADSADIFIRASELQYNTDKDIVIDNLEKYYGSSEEILAHHSNERQKKVVDICDCKVWTYYAWFNRSRKNVRIPLISLCQLAVAADVDIFNLFEKQDGKSDE